MSNGLFRSSASRVYLPHGEIGFNVDSAHASSLPGSFGRPRSIVSVAGSLGLLHFLAGFDLTRVRELVLFDVNTVQLQLSVVFIEI